MNNLITNLLLIKDQNITFVQIFGAITVNVNIKMYKSDKIKMYNYSKLT